MQYGGYDASKSLHATLHAAPFIPAPHGGAMPPVTRHCSMGGAGGRGAEGGGEGGKFFHANLHAAPFVYTAAAQRQEHNNLGAATAAAAAAGGAKYCRTAALPQAAVCFHSAA